MDASTVSRRAASPSPAESVCSSLDALLDSGLLSDVTLCAGGEDIPAHRNILACRSAVFRAMFETDCWESSTGRVQVTDLRPGVVKHLLR